ncbi:MAG TPA: GNAT family protein [Mycobacteriales bacterium]|nr:GNAT family protein [Mycobacteriales bacterium]
MTSKLPDGRTLRGRYVVLELLSEDDLDQLYPILSDARVYESGYVMHRRPTSVEDSRALARERNMSMQGQMAGNGIGRLAYAVRLVEDSTLGHAGRVVGTTSLLDAHPVNESIHIGSTMYGPDWWGTVVNPECKLLLMQHAFDDCGYGRVKIQTDLLNTRSQAAIAKLGAVREGVLRREMRREDGTFRDTVVFSVIIDEWPRVRAGLEARVVAE